MTSSPTANRRRDSDGRLMLVDAASLYFRAFYGVPDGRREPAEAPNNAIRGFLDMLATLVAAHRPAGLVACWDDDWRPAFRVAAVPTYKTHRLADGSVTEEAVPPELAVQVPVIVDALAAVGLARVGAPGYEADDVIGTLATQATRAMGEGRAVALGAATRGVDIVTGDRDLFQLVDDAAGVRVLYTARGGVREATVVDQAYLRTTYGVGTGAAYADLAVLRGDPSDGLPGVPGVGEKTAAGLLATYGDLAGLVAAIDAVDIRLKGAQAKKLAASRGYLDVAPAVVRVARDCPLPAEFAADLAAAAALPTAVADARLLSSVVVSHRLTASVNRLLAALGLD